MPDVILVGHSLGGAVVTEVAKIGALGKAVQGYAVLDVVEGMYTFISFYLKRFRIYRGNFA